MMPNTPNPIEFERRGEVAWVWMNRAEVHNAFDESLIDQLTAAVLAHDADEDIRVIVVGGRGNSYSAGGDLRWMQRQAAASADENLAGARKFAELFRALAESSTPTIARVHGAAIGGGMGLAAACHLCIAASTAVFAASEVRIGLMPAAIAPHLLRAIGERQAFRYFQTAERISAARAREIGLVHEVAAPEQLDAVLQDVIDALLAGGPRALSASTALIRELAGRPFDAGVVELTAQRIAAIRATPEAREGMAAFLEKRPPAWNKS